MEWSFIQKLLQKMGFSERWISWMMSCVTSVQYKVLINGQPMGNITPKRGLRQGDPLSPYLFILCTEALIANIQKAKRDKFLTGIKIARNSPSITHLLFADDSLFFCRANKEECQVILGILKNYESASGQQINFDKSSLQFGHKVTGEQKEELKEILGKNTIGGMGTYLGIPESLGGPKAQIFGFINERLQNIINGWTFKFLSKGGKEILIKSVLTALPTHVMSCYRLPKTVTKKLTGAISNFWWSSNGNDDGMHWMAWNRMCSHKKEGGIGFRKIEDFNTAMLAKQLWRLLDTPESLFSKVFKSRYFRNTDPLDPIKSYAPSYGWQSIISARSLVRKGLIKRVGTGSSISVWNDPWIPAPRPRPATSKLRVYPQSYKVTDLIDQETKMWNISLLNEIIIPEDVSLIQSMAISRFERQDSMGWHFTKNGKYSVKSGYRIEQIFPDKSNQEVMYGPTIISIQARIWQIKCPPKLQHFIWQAVSGCVAVAQNLNARKIKCDLHCVKCGIEEESINHVLFECPPALQTWALSSVPSNPEIFPSKSIFTNLDYLLSKMPTDNPNGYFPWIIWYLWKSRNEKIFKNRDKDPREILKQAETEGKLWQDAQLVENGTQHTEVQTTETRFGNSEQLPHDMWYCQIDGSWKELDNFQAKVGSVKRMA